MQSVNIHEAKTHFSKLVEAASEGEEIIIARAGKPAARLIPFKSTTHRGIRFGLMRDAIAIAEDFDAPLPEEVLRQFEGEK